MNFLVIGHLCYDEINYASGEKLEGFGGIYYAAATLAVLGGKEHTVLPVFPVGKDKKDELLAKFKSFGNVVTDGIYEIDQPVNRVKIFYGDRGTERIECSEHIAPPVSFDAIRPFLRRSNAILINMISGFDITYDTLLNINEGRGSREKPIYFDFHSLTLGINEDNKRFRRPMIDWRRWAFNLDIVQMNEDEAAQMTVEKLPEEPLAKTMLALGPRAFVVTRGERGAVLYCDDRKKTLRQEIPGIRIERGENGKRSRPDVHSKRDPTGCGDVFGAAYLYKYMLSGDFKAAAEFANEIAARKVPINGSDNLEALNPVVEMRTE